MKRFALTAAAGLILLTGLVAQTPGTLPPTAVPATAPVAAETAATPAAVPDVFTAKSQYYEIVSHISQADADEKALIMEALLAKYNSYLLLDLSKLKTPFKVEWFSDKAAFNTYLADKISQPRNDFVYLSYKDVTKSVLAGYEGAENPIPSLAFQGFVQYLWNFVPQAPVWVRNGFGYYFWDHQWNPETKSLESSGSLAFLDQAKESVASEGQFLENLLTLTDKTLASLPAEKADPLSWSLVYFLINANNPVYNRILGNVMGVLDETAEQELNTDKVKTRLTAAVQLTALDRDLRTYLGSLEGFTGTMKAGIAAYRTFSEAKRTSDPGVFEAKRTAVQYFERAKVQKPLDYRPVYYLGLAAYTDGDYVGAEAYFRESMALGKARDGLLPYALGLAQLYQKKTDEAVANLSLAKEQNADEFGSNVDTLLAALEE